MQNAKFVQHNANAVAAGRVAPIDTCNGKNCGLMRKTQVGEVGKCALFRCV